MYIYNYVLFLFLCFATYGNASQITFSKEPCAVAYTPNSVLLDPPSPGFLRYAGDRPRYSTCSGVCWHQNDKYIFAVNMQSSSIEIYEFSSKNKTSLTPILHFGNEEGMNLKRPEGLYISKNNKYLVIPNSGNGVKIYQMDTAHLFNPIPIAQLEGFRAHGAQFSPDSKFLAYTTLGKGSHIDIYRIIKRPGKPAEFIRTQLFNNQFEPMRPKSIDFSKDGRFVAVGHCMQLGNRIGGAKALIAIYKFDKELGLIDPTPVSYVDGIYSNETVTFSPDSTSLFAVDQVNDRITGHHFNPQTGILSDTWVALENPEAQLSLPHGIAFSSDGKHVAVSNYGDDKVTVYKVKVQK